MVNPQMISQPMPLMNLAPVREVGAADDDLSALSWIYDELRRTLEAANKTLRRYLKEAEAAGASDIDAVEPAVLRQARHQLHQAVGALELVGLGAAAQPLRAAETALARLGSRPRLVTPAAVQAIEQASFAVLDYLARRLARKPVSPLALFPQYRALQELGGVSRVHPADLWPRDWSWQTLAPTSGVAARHPDDATIMRVEADLLALMRGAPGGAAQRMSMLFAELGAGATGQLATLWQLAAAFFEAQAGGQLVADVYAKRVASRLLAQLRAGAQAEASERLAQDLLFFCAQAAPTDGHAPGPRLAAVREAWNLAAEPPVDYEIARLGRFDPAWINQARKRVATAKEVWSAVAAGEVARLPGLGEPLALVGDSLQRLYPEGATLARALQGAAAQTQVSGREPAPEMAMEVATGLLYLEASLEDAEFDHPEMAPRVRRLAQRVDDVCQGRDPGPLELWIEEIYRRVSERQTLGSVVQELRASLSEVEQQIDQYFRDPARRELLMPVPAQLSAMRGVLSVLGMDQASQAVLRMRDDVDTLANTEVDARHAVEVGLFDHLADNLGTLSFLIDMVSVQPLLAKSMFRFDAASGSLTAVMGRAERTSDLGVPEPASGSAPALVERARSLAHTEVAPGAGAQALARDLERLAQQAHAADQEALAELASRAQTTLAAAADVQAVDAARHDLAASITDLVAAQAEPRAPTPEPTRPVPPAGPPALPGQTGLEEDAEMREVFIEEAREVLEAARGALGELHDRPDDLDAMTTVRRAFHTLKGSARMVGLREFGEAAWACEQLYNSRLADAGQADGDLRDFSAEAFDHFERWADAIAAGQAGGFRHEPVAQAADALRLERRRLPIADIATSASMPVATAPTNDATAAPAAVAAPIVAPARVDFAEFLPGAEAELPLAGEAGSSLDAAPAAAARAPYDGAATVVLAPSLTDRIPDLPLASDLDLMLPGQAAPTLEAAAAPGVEPSRTGPNEADLASGGGAATLAEQLSAAIEATLASGFDLLLPEMADARAPRDSVAAAAPGSEPLSEPLPQDLIDVDLGAFDAAPPAAPPAHLPRPAGVDFGDEGFELIGLEGVPGPDARADGVATPAEALPPLGSVAPAAPAPVAPPPAAAVPAPELDEALDDEPVKVIGSLRIGIPLFNIYLNEADELSRRLSVELAEWTHELYRPVGEAAIALAHSLAGSSATVGFSDLSQLARSLEHGLMRAQSRGHGQADEAELFNQAADEVRRLLHQFAAGFLRSADADLLQRLAQFEHALPRPEPASDRAAPGAADPADAAAGTFGAFGQPGRMPFEALSTLAKSAPALAPEDALDSDDDIDLQDAVDAELFPVFEEEAQELIPQLQSRLREWAQRPDNPGAAAACMRTLHTLKGGARLAGAMRLGELAHRLETAVEHLLAGGAVNTADVERLVGRADVIEACLDSLRQGAGSLTPEAAAAAPAGLAASAALAGVSAQPEPVSPGTPAPTGAPEAALEVTPAAAFGGAPMPSVAIDWTRFTATTATPEPVDAPQTAGGMSTAAVRVRAPLLDRLVNHAGEVSITRARIEADVAQFRGSLGDLTESLDHLRGQLREIELQAETQIGTRMEAARAAAQQFDPLELDRFTRFQELTRMMAESVNDVATLQRGLQRTLQSTEDELASQARLTRDLQQDLLRTRMVEFESLSERLYRVVRLAAKETGKQVRLDIVGGSIEVDRGVLDRITGAFEHLLRNAVVHGIEPPNVRRAAAKDPVGAVRIAVTQEGNEVGVEFRDDGAGLDLQRIRAKGVASGLLAVDADPSEAELAALIFQSGFSTADEVTDLAGRGVGMDVVRADVNAMGGRIETASARGQGSSFRLLLPLTTAVTQVVMLRCADLSVAVPSTLVETVRRIPNEELARANLRGSLTHGEVELPLFWLGALLQGTPVGPASGRSAAVLVIRSAAQRIALHVDEVLGNQEAVVKNLGPQLSRLPGLAGITLLPSGLPALIYNPVALATLYGGTARAATLAALAATAPGATTLAREDVEPQAPLVLVVDDSLTVRRVTRRLLEREGYRVVVAKDGIDGLARLADELPVVVLTDIEMPRMDGFELVRTLRADTRLGGLPVVMITSRIAQKHRDYAVELGVEHYLGKPYAEDELLAVVARYARQAVPA